jgi:hypothetical protein
MPSESNLYCGVQHSAGNYRVAVEYAAGHLLTRIQSHQLRFDHDLFDALRLLSVLPFEQAGPQGRKEGCAISALCS